MYVFITRKKKKHTHTQEEYCCVQNCVSLHSSIFFLFSAPETTAPPSATTGLLYCIVVVKFVVVAAVFVVSSLLFLLLNVYNFLSFVTGWPCTPGQAVASLETLSIKESFLGRSSALLAFGRLAMHNKSPGSLCHATGACAWRYPSRVPCLTGLVCACGVATLDMC
jgi:hypothetical protein